MSKVTHTHTVESMMYTEHLFLWILCASVKLSLQMSICNLHVYPCTEKQTQKFKYNATKKDGFVQTLKI